MMNLGAMEHASRTSVVGCLAALALVSACSSSTTRSSERPTRGTEGPSEATGARIGSIRFVQRDATLLRQCQAAANLVGYAVPCPRELPSDVASPHCDTACGGLLGSPPVPMFFLSDVFGPSDSPRTIHHVVIEAFPRAAHILDPPCPGATRLSPLRTSDGVLARFHCGFEDGPANPHGEGIHSDHDFVRWYRGGVAYVVSLHRSDVPEDAVMRAVVEGIEYVIPTDNGAPYLPDGARDNARGSGIMRARSAAESMVDVARD